MLYARLWNHNAQHHSNNAGQVTVSTLVISQALIRHQDGVSLHPDLFLWQKQLSSYRQQWFDCTDKNPLGWYAALCGISPTVLLASQCEALPEHTVQCWSVSPYHARIMRDTVRVMPEGEFSWTDEDAGHLCVVLNPLLAEEGMQLFAVGSALLLACREKIEAYPLSFGEISGKMLPDRHHEGEDGGRLNRLLSEIQMTLFQHPLETRHDRGEAEVNGIWLWAPVDWPQATALRTVPVATRHPALQSMADGRDAVWMISEVERLHGLVKKDADAALPKRMVLAGEGYAVLLNKSWLPRLGKTTWYPKAVQDESQLLKVIRAQSLRQVGD